MIRSSLAAGAALLTVLLSATPAHADAERDRQWYFAPLQLTQAQELGKGGDGVIVAVIDSGVDTRQQDLRGAVVPGRVMAGDRPDDNFDDVPHGTAIAVLIAGRGHGDGHEQGGGQGLLGVAPRSKVMPIRPVNDALLVANGVRWAVEHGAKVINMSFQLHSDQALQDAIDQAAAADVVVVGAAGNEGADVSEPASFANVLAVGSVDSHDKVAAFSNRGPALDLVTYGTDLPIAKPDNGYTSGDGTSGSSAIVAGAAALVRARYPDMTAAEVVDRLTSTATDRGAKGRDDLYGAGELNLMAALTAPRAEVSTSPSTVETKTGTGTETEAEPADDGGSGVPPLVFVGVGVVLLAGVGSVLQLRRKRRG